MEGGSVSSIINADPSTHEVHRDMELMMRGEMAHPSVVKLGDEPVVAARA